MKNKHSLSCHVCCGREYKEVDGKQTAGPHVGLLTSLHKRATKKFNNEGINIGFRAMSLCSAESLIR